MQEDICNDLLELAEYKKEKKLITEALFDRIYGILSNYFDQNEDYKQVYLAVDNLSDEDRIIKFNGWPNQLQDDIKFNADGKLVNVATLNRLRDDLGWGSEGRHTAPWLKKN
tara:strand:+ start:782 stop:1117 length:336 start_codon:yes stop_codon:yes gene_type:complete